MEYLIAWTLGAILQSTAKDVFWSICGVIVCAFTVIAWVIR